MREALRRATGFSSHLRVSTKIAEGRPAERIVEAAKEGKFDIIIMGSRGMGGAREFFLGSVSHRVAIEAPCPVLIVK